MIDLGEACLAVVGVRSLFNGGSKITAPQWARIHEIDKRIDFAASDLVNGSFEAQSFEAINYDATLLALASNPDLTAVTASFPLSAADYEIAFVSQAARAFTYLRGRFPVSVVKTVTGVVNLDPSGFAVGMFEDTLEVVNDPFAIFGIVQADRMTSQLVLDLMAVFPSMYSEIVQSIVLRIVAKKATETIYEPAWGRSLAVLLAVPGIDQGLRDQLQTSAITPPKAPNPPPQAAAQAAPSLLAMPSQKLDLAS